VINGVDFGLRVVEQMGLLPLHYFGGYTYTRYGARLERISQHN
jgi:hypothetical protein